MSDLRVTLLGTGIPDPQWNRYGSSTFIEAGIEKLLFDCGRCALQRLFQTGTPVRNVNKLFLTHLHSDHTVGIPDLWLTPWVLGRKVPFCVWGPVGTQKMMSKLEEAFEFDLQIRPVHDLLQAHAAKILAQDIQEGVVYEKNGVKVTAFEVDHRPIKPSFGYRVDYDGKSVVLSGDTRFSENLIQFSQNVDILMHNVAAAQPEDLRQSERLRNIMALHLSPEEAGNVFERSKPKLAVYTHMVLFSVSVEYIVTRTRQTYSGPLEIGEDLMVFEVGETITIHRP
jgi:ribonuclease Z